MEENWKTIPFEDNYEVSDFGRVRNKETKHVKGLRLNRSGYLRVTVYPSGKTYTVHQLVGRVWLADSYREGLQIDHLNGIRDDNRVCNLEWVTQKENISRIKNRFKPKGELNPCSKITEEDAYFIKYCFDKTVSELREEFGYTRGIVEGIRRREDWTHVLDEELEVLYSEGKLSYKKGHTANLSKEDRIALNSDLVKGVLSNSEIMVKYGVSRSAVCRAKRKLV